MLPLFASGFEDLIGLLVFAAFAIISHLAKRKRRQAEDASPWPQSEEEQAESFEPERKAPPPIVAAPRAPNPVPPPIPTEPPPVSREESWEERLSRQIEEMARGMETESDKPQPVVLPPVIVKPPPLPKVPQEEGEEGEEVFTRAPKVLEKAAEVDKLATQFDHRVGEKLYKATSRLGALDQAAAASQKARELDLRVMAQLKHAGEDPVALTKTIRRERVKDELNQVLKLLRQPRSARQVILASVILGPPKALE